MKFMILVKATRDSEVGVMPTPEDFQAMGKFNDDLLRAGVMQEDDAVFGGLRPTSEAVRVTFSGKERIVKKGPFPNTRELVAGFWIWNCKSLEEAIDWVKRCPNPMPAESDIEIRPFFVEEDFQTLMENSNA